MTTALNLYATKAFSEHPIALWPLDDDASFISLITNNQRLLSNWNVASFQNCSYDNTPNDLPDVGSPFDSDIYTEIIGLTNTGLTTHNIYVVSNELFKFDNLNQSLKTFCINFYLYQNSVYANEYTIGYKYTDTLNNIKTVSKTVAASEQKEWINFNLIFTIPQDFKTNTGPSMFIDINVDSGHLEGEYNFIINGLSIGQESETLCAKTLGRTVQEIPIMDGIYGLPADQYGVLSNSGYYVSENNMLLAQNAGPSMIFGTDTVTKIKPSLLNNPSFIFPGNGMLNENGRYRTYTLEMWIRIDPQTTSSKKIIGPINNDYGVYIKDNFLSLVIGNNIASYQVGEWYRPMLMHLVFKNNSASMLINGEQVLSIDYDRTKIDLPTGDDWWAIYSYSDISLFEIDCIAIYPYAVPNQIAKKRFAWGQAVESLQFINNDFKGYGAAIDFSNSEYTSNIIYPDIAKWDAAYFNNLIANKDYISTPDYKLPNIYLSGRSVDEWYEDNKTYNEEEYPLTDHPKFISFRPNSGWTEQCYLNFGSLNIINDQLSSMYGIFETESLIQDERPLLYFKNTVSGENFLISISETNIFYKFNNEVLYQENIDISNHFIVGINIEKFSNSFGYKILNFFGSLSSIQLYVGGNGIETFEGKIYRIGFCNQNNYQEISNHFNNNGIVDYSQDDLFTSHFASYTLMATEQYNRFFLDISVSSQWEEYYPLSYFASYIKDNNNSLYYDLDYLQINIGYPSYVNDWNYQGLFNYGKNEDLSYSNLSLFETYSGIKNAEIYTSSSSINQYITFQLLSEGANEPLTSFIYTKQLDKTNIIDAEQENTTLSPYNAYKTKFSFVDNTIIYPPKTFDLEDVAMVVHLNIKHENIISNPIKIKNMQITSKALNENSFNVIGTKFGIPLYSYVKDGFYYNKKAKNPILIYKGNTPYLYMTKNSGIQVLKNSDSDTQYSISMPINTSKSKNFNVSATQMWIKYEQKTFADTSVLFEIEYLNTTIEFVITPHIAGNKMTMFARDKKTKLVYENIVFYQNGIKVNNPVFEYNQWNVLGLSFIDAISFNEYVGSINLFSKAIFNNISYYLEEGLGKSQSIIVRPWQKVLKDIDLYDSENNLDFNATSIIYNINNKELIDNIAKLTTSTNHSIDPGQTVIIDNVGAEFNGEYVVLSTPTTTTFTYEKIAANVPSIAVSPNGTAEAVATENMRWNYWNDFAWKSIYVYKDVTYYLTTPKDIYDACVGANSQIVDDNTNMLLYQSAFSTLSDATWSVFSGKPV